jgi:anthranilate 1,2-dioxygenase large subunit
MLNSKIWPTNDYSRVPYFLYHNQDVYDAERDRIFRGPVWLFLGLGAEVPNVGDFRTTFLGDVPVIFNRAKDGFVHAMVNRCAHRGATVRREAYGNAPGHICIYHRWSYNLEGTLIGIPFRKGVAGKGGMSSDFDMACHNLQTLKVENYHGILFASFSDSPEPLEEYLGPSMVWHLKRLMSRPVKVLGYQRQRIHGNWKLYCENLRDQYHGSLLHQFHRKFGISRVTQKGGALLDPRHRHNISFTQEGTDSSDAALKEYRDQGVEESELRLRDGSMFRYTPDFGDDISLAICSVFPNACFQQIRNSLAARQIRPRGVNDFELFWTIFGYEDDTSEMQNDRMIQTNMIGPAGLVSMEDGEAVEIAHRAASTDKTAFSVIEMGGGGSIPDHVEFKASDIPVRGFWSYYAELMGCEAEGGIR